MDWHNLVTVMISIPAREAVRKRTLENLERLGLNVDYISICNLEPGYENHKWNVLNALAFALDEPATHILFLEDNLDFDGGFPEALAGGMEAQKDVITYYVSSNLSFYPLAIRNWLRGYWPRPGDGLYRLSGRKKFFGSQALLFRSDYIRQVLESYKIGSGYFDGWVGGCGDLWLWFPNPVQHYGAEIKSSWSKHGQPHRSITYGR